MRNKKATVGRTAILYLTHTWSISIQREFERILTIKDVDVWILSDIRNPCLKMLSDAYERIHIFDVNKLVASRFASLEQMSLRGQAHLPLIDFSSAHGAYDRYWVIEYDVRYTGSWSDLSGVFIGDSAHFISAHIRRYNQEPDWRWWPTFGLLGRRLFPKQCLRSFNVCYSISAKAIEVLKKELDRGWRGHHEVLMVTLIYWSGLTIADFGGRGLFTPASLQNRFYSSTESSDGSLRGEDSSLRYRPVMAAAGCALNLLYHPVKNTNEPDAFAIQIECSGAFMDSFAQTNPNTDNGL